jgi:hypothetical protein
MDRTTNQMTVYVWFKRRYRMWAAQCKEYDIAVQGGTEADALYQMQRCLAGCVAIGEQENVHPFNRFPSYNGCIPAAATAYSFKISRWRYHARIDVHNFVPPYTETWSSDWDWSEEKAS